MDVSVEEVKPDVNQPGPLTIVLDTVRGVARRVIGFFQLTKEEQTQAGIDLSGEGRGE
jgi:hypothetical protein